MYKRKSENDPTDRSECPGDSGNPIVYKDKVVGILNARIINSGMFNPMQFTCGKTPTHYTRVSDYLDLIDMAMKKKKGLEIVIIGKSQKTGMYGEM